MVEKSRLNDYTSEEKLIQTRFTMKWISLAEPNIRTWFVSWVAASPIQTASLSMNFFQTEALTVFYLVTTSNSISSLWVGSDK